MRKTIYGWASFLAAILLGLAALFSSGCGPKPTTPVPQVLTCYLDGRVTFRLEGDSLRMNATADARGRMVEHWLIRVPDPDGKNWVWLQHDARDEVCGPELKPG